MSLFFVDTSALAKRYITEIGSVWVLSWILPATGNVIVISEIAFVEMNSLLRRRVSNHTLNAATLTTLQHNFVQHFKQEYLVSYLETHIIEEAATLVDKHNLRTLDAIQLASAVQAVKYLNEPMTFVSADRNLLAAAANEGFATDDPNLYP